MRIFLKTGKPQNLSLTRTLEIYGTIFSSLTHSTNIWSLKLAFRKVLQKL